MTDWFDKFTNYIAYVCSLSGVFIASLNIEQWYFFSSIVVGLVALVLNWWHKRQMQKIAREQGIIFENN